MLTVEQWRDRVFEAFPAPRYPVAFAGIEFYRAEGGIETRSYTAHVFVRATDAPGSPSVCAGVGSTIDLDKADPEAVIAAVRATVATLETQWDAWDAEHPAAPAEPLAADPWQGVSDDSPPF